MTIRVYLMSEIQGEKPLKVFEYQIAAGEVPKTVSTGTFEVTPAIAAKLAGR
jgi:hypothetical protein